MLWARVEARGVGRVDTVGREIGREEGTEVGLPSLFVCQDEVGASDLRWRVEVVEREQVVGWGRGGRAHVNVSV